MAQRRMPSHGEIMVVCDGLAEADTNRETGDALDAGSELAAEMKYLIVDDQMPSHDMGGPGYACTDGETEANHKWTTGILRRG